MNSAWADNIRLGNPTYGGSGCPQGSAAVALAPDESSISILFDSYTAEAGGTTGRRLDRKSCNLAIPVHVPSGMSISILAVDYRGFLALPPGGSSVFTAEYFFAGGRGPQQTQTFRGEMMEDFLISNQIPLISMVWSPCGEDVILRTNASLRVQTNNRGEQAMASIDSQDIQGSDNAMMYYIETRHCR